MESVKKSKKELKFEVEELTRKLEEATETIEAIRTGQVDALVVQDNNGHQLFTLKSADQTYRVFIEKMTEGAVTLNRQGLIVYCNSAFATMLALPLSNVLGLPFADFVQSENQIIYEQLFEQCWRNDCKGEVVMQSENKSTPVQLSLTTLELDEGIALSVILTDLTLQKQNQEQLSNYNWQLQESNLALENSNHDLQQFASVASHDLQEPLRKIQIFSHLLKEDSKDLLSADSNMYLDKVMDSARRMKNLILDILDYSRLSSSNNSLDLVDLNDLVQDVLIDFDMLIHDIDAKIIVGGLPKLYVNKGQIRQVFQNIISNALKFMKPGHPPVVSIESKRIKEKSFDSETQADGPYCLISIHDNGIGFNQQYAKNIFGLFERLHSKEQYEGTGIGLAIAKKILEKHEGLIHVDSEVGAGSEFMIILPCKPNGN